jgi:hypothetical protein
MVNLEVNYIFFLQALIVFRLLEVGREILKLENTDEWMLCAVLLFYDKLLNLRQSDISTLSVTHVQNINFGSIRHNPKYTFTLLFISLPSVDGDPDDSTVIYFLLLLTCKVCEGDYSRHG